MTCNSFDGIPERLQAGDDEAARQVFGRFTHRLISLARARLDKRIQSRVDPSDVVNSVYRSFFLRQQAKPFDLESWDSLWALLARITVRKAGRRAQKENAARRDVRREVRLGGNSSDSVQHWDPPAREPTAEEAAVLDETLSQLMDDLKPEKRDMLVLRLQGYTVEEISRQMSCTERSVYRLMNIVRNRLREIEATVEAM